MHHDDALDAALERLARHGPDLANGMTSHAPMAADALCALERGDAIAPWLDRYAALLLPRPAPRERIDATAWRAALGRHERAADWSAFFAEALREQPWRGVIATWIPRLAPGLCAAATHGPIRVAHAVRALGRRENALRLDELAVALGYWAATYQELPVARDDAAPTDAASAFARIAVVPPAERRFTGTITGALAALDAHAPFAPVIGWLDVSPPIAAGIGALSATFAQACLANVHDALTAIVFVHGVTSSAALRALAPHLDDATGRAALRYAWQAGAGLHAAFGRPEPDRGEPARPTLACADLVERAVAHGDEHAIKMVEAAIAETRAGGDGFHLAAAERVLAHLEP